MILLAASLFFTYPSPLDMPRAESYRLKYSNGASAIEDRYNENDLWTSRAVLGRWEDDDGRFFTVSVLDVVPPAAGEGGIFNTLTRVKYAANEVALDPKKDKELRREAIRRLTGMEIAEKPLRPHQMIRGFKDIQYFEGENPGVIVCAFLRQEASVWYLATWELVEGDEQDLAREIFEKEFLENFEDIQKEYLRSENGKFDKDRKEPPAGAKSERELMRLDARHSVTNYASWHATEAEEFTILDCLGDSAGFIGSLTNDMAVMRKKYSAALPSPLIVTNTLCVARIFADRADYIAAAGEDMAWSAAYWNPIRRELVAYLGDGGEQELHRTIRHEAFHQYLSYATGMIATSPWLNEGYAQYFEDEDSLDWKLGDMTPEKIEALAQYIPGFLGLDYDQFYSENPEIRNLNYRLAWSIAVFLEKGADEVRFKPFKNLKSDYIAALLESGDMREASARSFKTRDNLKLFIAEWEKFWKNT